MGKVETKGKTKRRNLIYQRNKVGRFLRIWYRCQEEMKGTVSLSFMPLLWSGGQGDLLKKKANSQTCLLLYILSSYLSPVAFNNHNQFCFTNIDCLYITFVKLNLISVLLTKIRGLELPWVLQAYNKTKLL